MSVALLSVILVGMTTTGVNVEECSEIERTVTDNKKQIIQLIYDELSLSRKVPCVTS